MCYQQGKPRTPDNIRIDGRAPFSKVGFDSIADDVKNGTLRGDGKPAEAASSSKQKTAKKGAVQKPKYSNVKPMEKKGGSERRSLFS